MALQFETERVGDSYTIEAAEDGTGSDLAGTVQVVRCRVRDDGQPNLQAEFDFQVWTHKEDGSRSASLRAVKVESLPHHHPIDASPITISMVREWPLARWESAARGIVSLNEDDSANYQKAPQRRGPITKEEQRLMVAEELLRAIYPEIRSSGDTPGERRRWNGLRKLAEVAVIYREIVREGRSDPAIELARIKETTPATARSWIHRARQAGLLGPAVGRTAGEAPNLERAREAAQAARAAQATLHEAEHRRDRAMMERDAALQAVKMAEADLAAIDAEDRAD